MDGVDLGGKIIFKVKLDEEIKKVIIHNDEINYNELLLMLQRIFSDRIRPNDEFRIKYADDENDLITIANDSDLAVAIQTTKILKITIYLSGKEEKVEEIKASEVISELRQLRTGIDSFLLKFERFLKLDSPPPKIVVNKNEESSRPAINDVKSSNSNTIIQNDMKEFDPLMKKGDLEVTSTNKFQPVQKNSRAETPDSIGSSEFTLNKAHHGSTLPVGGGAEASQSNTSIGTNNSHYDQQQQQQHQQYMQQQQAYGQQMQGGHPGQQMQGQQQPAQQGYNMQAQQTGAIRPNPQVPGMPGAMMPQPTPQQQAYMQQPQQYKPNIQPQMPQIPQGSSLPMDPSGVAGAPGGVAQNQQAQQYPQMPPQGYYPGPQAPQTQQQPAQQQIPGQQNPAMMPPMSGYPPQQGMYGAQQAQQTPPSNNPYSNKLNNPNASLARPPSASIYQTGYK